MVIFRIMIIAIIIIIILMIFSVQYVAVGCVLVFFLCLCQWPRREEFTHPCCENAKWVRFSLRKRLLLPSKS